MADRQGGMDRRDFLSRSVHVLCGVLTGGLIGLHPFRRAVARAATLPELSRDPCLAIIIDDIGYSPYHARRFLNLKSPLTFSILPHLDYSHEMAQEIHALGHEIMLHQPMEPYNPSIDPGPGALYVGDRTEKIQRVLRENLAGFPFAIGVNNHMGSRFTEHPAGIREALKVIKGEGLFFIDSLTSNRSVAFRVARRLSMPSAARDNFLDTRPESAAILQQLESLKRHAALYGTAIGIGHPYQPTADALARFVDDLPGSGISIVPVSRIINT